MALLLTEDFENFTDAPWALNGAPTIGPARTGNGLVCVLTSDKVRYLIPAPYPTTITTGFAYQTSTLAQKVVVQGIGGTEILFYLYVYPDGHIVYTRGQSTTLASSAAGVIRAGVWQFIELTVTLSLKGGIIKVRVDGTTVIDVAGQPTLENAASTAYFSTFALSHAGAGTVTAKFDDVYLRDDQTMTGDAPVMPPAIPTAPTALNAVQSGSSAALTWTPPPAAPAITGNVIERAPDVAGAPGTWATVATVGAVAAYTDASAPAGAWWYRVSAINSLGTGPASAPDAVLLPLPPQVQGFRADLRRPQSAQLTWTATTATPAVTGYKIERAPDTGSSTRVWAAIATVGAVVNYVDETPGLGLWWYRASAINGLGTGPPSEPDSVRIPTVGCPLGDDFPGWLLFIDAYFTPTPGRTYGEGTYGSGVYGDLTVTGPEWVDITEPTMSLTITAGNPDAGAVVPVSQFDLEVRDNVGDYWELATPARYHLPGVGTPIRFGLIDPSNVYHPLGVGHVDSIVDEHDTLPRLVSITSYGNMSWLVTSKVGWQQPAQTVETRIAALVDAAGAPPSYSIEPTTYPPVTADAAPKTIVVRDELDRMCMSAGWYMSEDRYGLLRFRAWPHQPVGPTLKVSDCPADETELLASPITFIADTGAVLNVAQVTNDASPALASESLDTASVAKYGRRSEAIGFPQTGLAYTTQAAGDGLASAARSRYQDIVNRVETIGADTKMDLAWLEVLADLDLGRYVQIVRRGVGFYFLEAVVIGYEITIEPNHLTATINVSTITPTL